MLGRYELERLLASGGMADVWLATVSGPVGFKKKVVVKTLRRQLAEDPSAIEMFVQEARLAAHLEHPNIVQVFDFGQVDDNFFIAMEFVSGANMRQIQRQLRKQNKLAPIALVLVTLSAVCEALAYAHSLEDEKGSPLGIVHRDVSPDNIMVTYTGATKVVDFGIAKANLAAVVTDAGVVKGKYAYMSPEQLVSSGVDRRSDLYSLGVVAYELLTGRKPFRGKSNFLVMKAVLQSSPASPRTLAPWLSERLEQFVIRSMQRNPADRFANAIEMGAALDAAINELPEVPSRRAIANFVRKLFSGSSLPPPASEIAMADPKPARVPKTTAPPPPLAGSDNNEIIVEIGEEDLVSIPPDANNFEGLDAEIPAPSSNEAVAESGDEVDLLPDPPVSGDVDGGWDRVGEESSGFEWDLRGPAESGQSAIDSPPSSDSSSPSMRFDAGPQPVGPTVDMTPEAHSTLVSAVEESHAHRRKTIDAAPSEARLRVDIEKPHAPHPWDVAASRLVASSRASKEAARADDEPERQSPPSSSARNNPWDAAVHRVRAEESAAERGGIPIDSSPTTESPRKEPPSLWDRAVRSARGEGSTSSDGSAPIQRKAPIRLSPKAEAAKAFDHGLACFRRKEYDEALRAWERACELAPEERRYLVNLSKLRKRLSGEKP